MNDRYKTEPDFAAKTVRECWQIVREETERYQEAMNLAVTQPGDIYGSLKMVRDALDMVAQRIKVGEPFER